MATSTPAPTRASRIGRFLQSILKTVREWKEYARFRRSFFFLAKRGPAPGEEVFLVSFTDWAPRLQLEGLIAARLRFAGRRVTVITRRSHRWAVRYFRACGVRDFVFFDEWMQEAASDVRNEDALALLEQHHSFAGLFQYSWNGVGVGRHVLSTVARQRLQGSVTFDDPETDKMLRSFFPQSLRAASAARKLFAERSPKAVLFLEKGYTPYGEIFDVALEHRLNVVQYHHAHQSDMIVMKRYTTENRFQHSHSLSTKSWETVKAMPWSTAQDEVFMAHLKRAYTEGTWFNRKKLLAGKRVKTSEEVREQLRLDPAKKTAVVFSHILWDATFFFGTNLFEDYEKWLIATVRAACANSRVNWVVKLHPDYTWKMRAAGQGITPRDVVALASGIGELPPHVIIVPPETDISTYSFFGVMDYAITVRGTIGIEAPCFGIPVLTAGTGRYSGLGFTEDSRTPEEYLAKLDRIETIPRLTDDQARLARKHAHALFNLRPLRCSSFSLEASALPDGRLENTLRITTRSRKAFEEATDLQAFADWVLTSRDDDFLAPI
ncbi:MAG: hypothetical protein G01um101425_98 [Candidatus Peregrinibacteria bacterium Gr01-1014_25]|nr:MAG: hypothetical protein G01um101425_98 [Candidatus Peregrinibacteria bacterium Gr01-1014_25]